MTKHLSEKIRGAGRDLNLFGGYEELEALLEEAASRLEALEFRNLHLNVLLKHIRDMNRELGTSMRDVADLLADSIIEVI